MSNRFVSDEISCNVIWIGFDDFRDNILWHQMRQWVLDRLRAVHAIGHHWMSIEGSLSESLEDMLSD